MKPQVTTRGFGLIDQHTITEFTISFEKRLEVRLINSGGIITSIKTPDKKGDLEEVTVGYHSLEEYLEDDYYMGAVVGRSCGRIGGGKLRIGKSIYQLTKNQGENQLHGGFNGFNSKIWKVKMHIIREGAAEIIMQYKSTHGEEGYPGELDVEMHFLITVDSLRIIYKCSTDRLTYVNLTHHPYFNLSGGLDQDILSHELMIRAAKFIPVDKNLIPIGTLSNVVNTPFDFRESKLISSRMDLNDKQIVLAGGGYDHTWVLSTSKEPSMSLIHEGSGRKMEITTDKECVQFYTGNFLDGSKNDRFGPITKHRALCLEPQAYPDAVNQPKFPVKLLQPDTVFESFITYQFSTLR